ncbi:hypothetical protein K450DRAFT_239874 [Umbelopsis ramanniana AG]|uniref:Alpha/beta hydrolase fold-3 domain-containing protein n=1 Tax=Umbelopsis ramanniana AG TaxID=1314678 RepID=A0AAD5EBP0_UMBRA|nr:uncharacterized protein K450DRAFT_239874 [Umbelopsis ramanniana AG]KAI8579950.1 hypothetical protein K450DRAFT_239874 [Umbelopsis ramanniana AG]
MQWLTSQLHVPLPPFTTSKDFIVPSSYRLKAGSVIESAIDKNDYPAIGWDWIGDKKTAPPLSGEWLAGEDEPGEKRNESVVLYVHGGAGYMGSTMTHRLLTSSIAKATGGRVCAINQRLAPQHPFPAPLEDALTTYLQLIDKENSEGVDPKNVIIAGESHGGGMVMALLLLLRDCKLPMPAGAIGLSPWVDLTHSLPSILTNISTDYLPASGFSHKHSRALEFNNLPQFEPEALGPLGKAVRLPMSHEDLDRVQFYAPNSTLKMRYVSPIFDEQGLHGLPPLLIQVGTAERLRDESIYSAYKASNQFPDSPSPQMTAVSPTQVKLELYVDQPHVFQMILATKQRAVAIHQIGEFVKSLATGRENAGNQVKSPSHLQVCTVQPNGEITEGMTDPPTKEVWDLWEKRLERPSLRERLEEVQHTLSNLRP